MLDFLYRLRIAHSPDVVSSFVSPWRPVGRLVLSCLVVSLLACNCSYSSRGASRSSSRSIVSSRLVLLIASPLVSRSIPVPLGYRLIVLSCWGVLLARLVSFSFVLSPCGYVMRRSCWERAIRIITMGVRLVPYGSLASCLFASKP